MPNTFLFIFSDTGTKFSNSTLSDSLIHQARKWKNNIGTNLQTFYFGVCFSYLTLGMQDSYLSLKLNRTVFIMIIHESSKFADKYHQM